MAQRELDSHKCGGRFRSLIHTRVDERESVRGLKEGVQGFIHKLQSPKTNY